jgi:dTDP-4-amino-4,6-dideoxygalactose transaminase
VRQVPPAHTPIPPSALLALASPEPDAPDILRGVLAKRWGSARMELLGSGTQALQRAIELAGVGPSRRGAGGIALPGWGCFDLASAAVGAGLRVRLYDLEPETLQPDPDALEVVAGDVDGIVVVSFFGIPVEPSRLPDGVGAGDGPILIHDAAQAHGAVFGPDSIESVADATVLSFGRGKGWTGLSGGALILKSDRLHERARRVPARLATPTTGVGESAGAALRGAAQWALGRPSLYGVPARIPALGLGETRYHPPHPLEALGPGAAAVLLASAPDAEQEAAHRRESAAHLRAVLEAAPTPAVGSIRVARHAAPGYLRFPVLDRGGAAREAGRALGVLPSYPRGLARLEPLKGLLAGADPTPGSDVLAARLLTLPTHSRLSPSDRRRLDAWLTAEPSPRGP